MKNLGRSKLVHDVSFQVHAGEIVGFSGITGSGRTEVVRAIFGADPHSGQMTDVGQALQGPLAQGRHPAAGSPW